MSERTYLGSCRCGATRVTFCSRLTPEEFRPRSDAQTCGFCREHGGIWISDPRGRLLLDANNETTVTRFASGEVAFHFCAKCRELTYAICRELAGERQVAIARRALFPQIAAAEQAVVSTNFEGSSLKDARKRRSETWTPCKAPSAL